MPEEPARQHSADVSVHPRLRGANIIGGRRMLSRKLESVEVTKSGDYIVCKDSRGKEWWNMALGKSIGKTVGIIIAYHQQGHPNERYEIRRPLKSRKRVAQARAGDKPQPVYANGGRSHHGVSSPRRTRAPANSRCLQSAGKKVRKIKKPR